MEDPGPVVRLDGIEVPVLALWGTEDTVIPIETGRRASAQIPCHRFVPLPDTGHLPMEEQPEAVAAALREFVRYPRGACRPGAA